MAIQSAFCLTLIAVVCIGVFLRMLGAPISFWDLDGSDDDFVSHLLMSLTVPSVQSDIAPLDSTLLRLDRAAPRYRLFDEHELFRPPVFAH